MSDKTYNGWTNYETWNVKLWLDNDEGLYEWQREAAHEAENVWEMLDAVRDFVEEIGRNTEPCPTCGRGGRDEWMFGDLAGDDFDRVNWYEIAEHILSDWGE